MTSRLRATTAILLILWIGWLARSAEATDLKNTIRNLYGIQGIHVEPSPFFPVETSFQASSLQGLDGLNSQLDRKSTRLNSSHIQKSRMPSSA